jgi:hypothetical protein
VWLIEKYNERAPTPLIERGRFTVLDIEVLAPGHVQIQGVWAEDERAVVITQDWLSICTRRRNGFVHLRGYGERRDEPKDLSNLPVFRYEGPIQYSVLSCLLHNGEI